jgi:hypothetical protein
MYKITLNFKIVIEIDDKMLYNNPTVKKVALLRAICWEQSHLAAIVERAASWQFAWVTPNSAAKSPFGVITPKGFLL